MLNVATLNIPEVMLKLLEQAFSHVSRSKALEYFSCFALYLSSSLSSSCRFPRTMFRWWNFGSKGAEGMVGEYVL